MWLARLAVVGHSTDVVCDDLVTWIHILVAMDVICDIEDASIVMPELLCKCIAGC